MNKKTKNHAYYSSQAKRARPQGRGQEYAGRRHKPDYALSIISIALLAIGLIVVYAIGPGLGAIAQVSDTYFMQKQLIAIALAFFVFIVVSQISFSMWKKLIVPLGVITLALLVATFLIGEEVNGAVRWIQIGGLSFQPVELVKFTIILWLAFFLAQQKRDGLIDGVSETMKPIGIVLAIIAFVVAILQSDLGSLGVIVAIAAAMMFVAGMSLRWFMTIIAVVLIGGMLLIVSSPYRQERVATFLNPQADCLDEGYQSCQALIAIGSGGLFGKGIDRSAQAYGYLPEAANDSIFAVLAEMFGFLGVSVVLGLLVGLFSRMVKIIERAPTMEMRLMVTGVLAWLSTQAFINIMAMVGMFPLKGITLPFISYGGTSLIFVTAAVALVFHISRYTAYNVQYIDSDSSIRKTRGATHENYTQRGRNRRTHYAHSYRRV